MEYGYKVQVRDVLGNVTEWSTIEFAGGADRRPPAPAPYIDTISSTSSQSIQMISTIAYDDNGVEYFFDANEVQGGHDSGWIDTPVYTDVNLVPDTLYCYRVKARDLSANRNETAYSEWVCVRTAIPGDTEIPSPSPMEFDPNGLPREYDADPSNNTSLDHWVEMQAVTATDDSGVVQYYFDCLDNSGFDSGWQDSTIYRVEVGPPGRNLRFRVRARDGSGNVTDWSDPVPGISRPEQPALDDGTGGDGGGGVVAGGG
jgi:hypothetical protein